jgi:hypothetical protein
MPEDLKAYVPDAERIELALEASEQIDSCAGGALMLTAVLEDFDEARHAVRALLMRQRELTSVLLSALGDPDESIATIREHLAGIV